MSDIVEEIRAAYARVGVRLDQPATYGTYYRLLCAACGRMVGNVGDRLLPGMAAAPGVRRTRRAIRSRGSSAR